MTNFYRIRKYSDKDFPKRFDTDTIISEFSSLKSACEESIRLNKKVWNDTKIEYFEYPNLYKLDLKTGKINRGYYVEEIK